MLITAIYDFIVYYIIEQMIEKEEYTQQMIQQIICNVIGYSQVNGNLLHKFDDHFYLTYFDRLKIDQTIKKVPVQHKQLQIQQFVRLFLSVIEHGTDQTLYLAISLSKLYRKIKQQTNNEKGVKFSDFTSFLCNKISEGDPDLVIPMKQISLQRTNPDTSKIRDIDINPPPILNKVQLQRPKITKDKNKKDKKLDEKKPVSKFIYSQSLKSIIALGRLSSSIALYDPKSLVIKHKIIPSTCKIMSKDVAILSIAFCQKQQRIGCIINNIGVTFWEASDSFVTEKIMGQNKSDFDPKKCGDKIYYLNLFQQWITTDRDTIYFWDLKQQQVVKQIKKDSATCINDICEVNHIRSILVSYNVDSEYSKQKSKSYFQQLKSEKHEQKILILYQDGKLKSKLSLQNSGSHSLSYNPSTQLIISLGYQSNIFIYQIDTKTFDINLVTQLQAHVSILTCVSNIPESSMIVTGDDIGFLKLWDLNYMRCLQSIKIAKGLTQLSCSENTLIYADSRINTIPIDDSMSGKKKILQNQSSEQSYGIYNFFRKEEESLWIITRKEAREIDIKSGRIRNILVICNAQQDISAAAELFNGFLIGTSRGEMSKFMLDGERKWKIMAHEGQIHSIRVDLQNHLIITVGSDNNLFIWPEKTITEEEGPRKRIVFHQTDVNLVQVCPYANLILITSSSDNKVTVWNYDNLKLAYKLQFDGAISTLLILSDKNLFLVSTIDGSVFSFLFVRKESKLKISLVLEFNINDVCLERSEKWILYNQTNSDSCDYITAYPNDRRSFVSKLAHSEDNNMILAATPKGLIYSFSPQNFSINSNYRREYQPTPILKRPMKESYDHQLIKNQFIKYKVSQMQIAKSQVQFIPLWYIKTHKDAIYHLNVISLQKKYACTLCVDGYFKFVELNQEQPTLVCSHKISFPLPVKWNIQVQNYCDLKNQIHQALAVIDTIIKDFSYQLTKGEEKCLNITPFMQKMITGFYEVKKIKRSAEVMSSQFSQSDIRQMPERIVTLKTLQAYKRLQLIKKHNQENRFQMKSRDESIYHYQTSNLQKESIRNFLQPNYLPKLLIKNQVEGQQIRRTPNDFLSRIQNILKQKESKKGQKDKDKLKQNLSGCKSQVKLQQGTIKRGVHGRNQEICLLVKQKSVKSILNQINLKLHYHKKSKLKAQQSFVVFGNS